MLNIEIEALEQVRDRLDASFPVLVDACLETLQGGGKLVVTGVGKSGHIGHKVAATLSSTGSPSVFMHPVEAMHGDLGLLASADMLLALSYSGETDELLEVLPAAKRVGARVVAITGVGTSRLVQWSDFAVVIPVPREACPFNLAPTATTTAMLALGDALALVLLQAQGFGKTDYAKLHPSGSIGRSITLAVSDIMRTGERFPRVSQDVTVREALLAMTRARSGSVAVVEPDNTLIGIFTDGDFRRHSMSDGNVLTQPIRKVVTRGPVTVQRDAMAVEVLRILENKRVDDLIVVDDRGHAIGLVDIQDLPHFKVM